MTLKNPIESELIARIANIREQLHSGRFGQREIWEQSLAEAETVLAAQAQEISAMRQTILSMKDGSLICDQAEEIAVQTERAEAAEARVRRLSQSLEYHRRNH